MKASTAAVVMLHSVSLLAMFAPGLVHAASIGKLRRKRVANGANVFAVGHGPNHRRESGSIDSKERLLNDLWGATEELHRDARRFLHDSSMSMNPTPSPTPSESGITDEPTAGAETPSPTNPEETAAPTTQPSLGGETPAPTFEPSLGGGTPSPTPVPGECLVGTTRYDYLLDVLSKVTDPGLLNDSTTPQGQAFNWIVDDDPLDFDPCTYPTIEQRYGLATLYFSTNGEEWVDSTGWLSEDVECDWFGIDCTVEGSDDFVKVISLGTNNLAGPIPNEISTLNSTIELGLFGNSLQLSIPTGIGALTNLKLVDLEENELAGTLFTPELLRLTQLQGLRASFNKLEGTIPAAISDMSNLEQLWLAENAFTGPIPTQVGALTNLDSIFLYSNGFTGAIPEDVGGLQKLTQFRMYNNNFDGTIPESLYSITGLQVLRLDSNLIEGTLSPSIGSLTQLTDLRLDNNFFGGTIPSEIGLLQGLENLLLDNQVVGFEGTVPDVFSGWSKLQFIDLSSNKFTGPLPPTLFDIVSIQLIYLANNTFTGSLPANFGTPALLRDLYLYNNELTGTVPEISSGSLADLNEFLIYGNSFAGSMPASVCALRDSTIGTLDDLWADCGGDAPEIKCDTPACCNRCFSDTAR